MLRATFRQLEIFEWVARLNSFTAAADKLDISQVAVSRQIAALERALDRRVFTRPPGRPVTLTPAGEDLLAKLPSLRAAVDSFQPGPRVEHIRIAAGDFLLEAHLHPAVSAFQITHPDTVIELVETTPTAESIAGLPGQGIDLAYFGMSSPPSEVAGELLSRRTVSLYGAPNHPAVRQDARGRDVDMVMPLPGTALARSMMATLRGAGLSPRPVAWAQRGRQRCTLAAHGAGLCIALDEIAAPFVAQRRLVRLPIALPPLNCYQFAVAQRPSPRLAQARAYFSGLLRTAEP